MIPIEKIYLQICIPTYNRPNKIENQVTRLLKQIGENDRIIIVDNNSLDFPYQSELFNDKRILFFKNSSNIGICANITESMNYQFCEWSWLLSDDDKITPNAVNDIKSNIANYNADFYNYSSLTKREGIKQFIGVSDFSNKLDNFANLLLMSNNVYRTSLITDNKMALYWACSMSAPHLGPLFFSLANNEFTKGVFCNDQIVEWGEEDVQNSWDRTCYYNILFLIDLIKGKDKVIIFNNIKRTLPPLYILAIQLAYAAKEFGQKSDAIIFFKKISSYYEVLGSSNDKNLALFCKFLLKAPSMNYFLISRLYLLIKGKDIKTKLQLRKLSFYI